jgi:hypothetical protein
MIPILILIFRAEHNASEERRCTQRGPADEVDVEGLDSGIHRLVVVVIDVSSMDEKWMGSIGFLRILSNKILYP